MKTAIYIEEGVTQLVLTPENEFEESVLAKTGSYSMVANVMRGGFYLCQGGWDRQNRSTSLIVRFTPKEA